MTGPERDPRTAEQPSAERPQADQPLGERPRTDQSSANQPPGGQPRRSGLRNPEGAVRGLGAGTLGLEALVLLLAIQPIRVVGGDLSGTAIGVVVALAVVAVLLAGSMRRPWAWHAGTVFQGLLMLAGLLHWSLLALGIIFALVWAYALHVRRVILG
ncbi:DUF4233 domain-containing protein [Micromonospora profundi]|uniref:DUF4233 domain-containing protein n=1 Tax=Micromonospora profundi TaxID=1420889 RepID=UPI001439E46C|nr:DUF4233 domain-containing protein [Micromonospora profundi]